jgi:hypothetical protein
MSVCCIRKFATDDRLVVVDCIRRFDGGGDTFLPLELGRLPKPGRVDISKFFIARSGACRLYFVLC